MHPLRNLRVLDLGQYITGPYATVMLGELGADVVKVEAPEGDPFRTWEGGPVKARFMAFNHGKRSVVLDLKTAEGQASLLDLVENADVLIENFRPGVMDRLGVGRRPAWSATQDLSTAASPALVATDRMRVCLLSTA